MQVLGRLEVSAALNTMPSLDALAVTPPTDGEPVVSPARGSRAWGKRGFDSLDGTCGITRRLVGSARPVGARVQRGRRP